MLSRHAFTIAELIVTALIALIITAIAIPQLSVGSAVATDSTAQLSVEAAASAEVTYYQSAQAFTASDVSLTNIDPSISYVSSGTASTANNIVSVGLSSDGNQVGLAALGDNGICWMERRSLDPATNYDAPVLYASGTTSESYACTAVSALAMNADPSKFTSSPAGTAGSTWVNPLLLP